MSDFETETALELLRATLSGAIINAVKMSPGSADVIVDASQEATQHLEAYVELKVGALTEGILASVRSEVTRILKEHLTAAMDADHAQSASVEVSDGSSTDALSTADLRDRVEFIRDFDDDAILDAFITRMVVGSYEDAVLQRLQNFISAVLSE